MSLKDVVFILDSSRRPIKESDRAKIKGIYPYYGASGIIDYVNSYIFDDDLILLSEDGANILDRSTRVAFEVHGKCWINNHAHVLKAKNHNTTFISEYLESKKYDDYNTGTAQPKINQEVMKRIPIYIPKDKEEENKIGNLLSLINDRIATQNKIIEDLTTLRKGIIDSFFKSSISSTRLTKYLRERKTYSEKGEGYEHVTLSKEGICPKTDRYDRDFLVKNEDKNYKITKLNDICYNPANLKFRVICLNDYGDAIFSPIYVTFEVQNIDPYYLSLYLTSESFIKRILKYQQGTVYERMAVGPDDFCKGKIPIKSEAEISNLINVVSVLDKKIKNERGILEKFCIQKSYLLNNLFI